MSRELDAIEQDIALLARQVGAQGPEIPTVGFSTHTGLPCVLEEGGAFVWLTMDSGREVSRETLTSRDEVLYRALQTMVYSVSMRYAVANAVPGVQQWAVSFKRRLELVRPVNHGWYVRTCREIAGKIEANTARGGLNSYVRGVLEECRSAIALEEEG